MSTREPCGGARASRCSARREEMCPTDLKNSLRSRVPAKGSLRLPSERVDRAREPSRSPLPAVAPMPPPISPSPAPPAPLSFPSSASKVRRASASSLRALSSTCEGTLRRKRARASCTAMLSLRAATCASLASDRSDRRALAMNGSCTPHAPSASMLSTSSESSTPLLSGSSWSMTRSRTWSVMGQLRLMRKSPSSRLLMRLDLSWSMRRKVLVNCDRRAKRSRRTPRTNLVARWVSTSAWLRASTIKGVSPEVWSATWSPLTATITLCGGFCFLNTDGRTLPFGSFS
mmetsp:Transcript_21865/g.64523  ORF Transcript_21865/g.64523 Transcript_21865/m.64523 type:complete len:288 (+) Transcript_21865:539-1402(+)